MKNPLVSILIPTYNQPEYFRQALESALNQTYPNIEIIVSDDSTDDRVEKVASEYKDRIQFFKHESVGNSTGDRIVSNIENLLELSHGEFINILFHDDLIYPQKISKMMDYFLDEIGKQIAVISSARNVIDRNGKLRFKSDLIEELNLYQNDESLIIPGESVGRLILFKCGNFAGELSTSLIRREDFYRSCVKKLSPGYFLGVKDQSMWDISTYLEACKDGRALAFFREPLSAFRLAGGNQNTYDGNVRLIVVVDWLAFITAAYLNDIYIHNRVEFGIACDYWLSIADEMIREVNKNSKLKIAPELIDQILRAFESVIMRDYETAFEIGVSWIQKYSFDTFDARYLP